MKMNKKLLALSATLVLASQAGSVAIAAQEPGDAVAVVIAPLTVSQNSAMDFGTVAGGANADTIVLTTAGTRTATGTDAQVIGAGGAAGNFTVSGEPGATYIVTFSASATLNSGGNTMTVNNFTDNNPSPIDAGGSDTLLVGGTLNIGANQPAGNYSTLTGGTAYTVTVNYN